MSSLRAFKDWLCEPVSLDKVAAHLFVVMGLGMLLPVLAAIYMRFAY